MNMIITCKSLVESKKITFYIKLLIGVSVLTFTLMSIAPHPPMYMGRS